MVVTLVYPLNGSPDMKKILGFLTFLIKLIAYALIIIAFIPIFALAILLTFDSKEILNYE